MKPNHDESRNNEHQTSSPLQTILSSAEGHIFLTGLVAGVVYGLWVLFWTPGRSNVFALLTVSHLLFGRAAGISFGYTMNFTHGQVILVNMIVESIILLLFYPLFVFSWRHLLVIRSLKNTMARIHAAAERNRDHIRKYGLLGLFLFVWFPFWMTGSIVGCVIGFLLNLHPWLNMSVVLAGSYVAIVSWAFLLHELHIQVEQFSQYASLTILGIIILIVVIGKLWKK